MRGDEKMKLDADFIREFVNLFVPEESRTDAMHYALTWTCQEKRGGRRPGAGAKPGNQNARKKTVVTQEQSESETLQPKQSVPASPFNEDSKFVAGKQGWTFIPQLRTIAAKYWSEARIRAIEKDFSCQEWYSTISINDLLHGSYPSDLEPEVIEPIEAAFMKWWEAYPKLRKRGTKKPHDKFVSIIKNRQATIDEIMAGTRAYAASAEVKRGFAKEPYSWLLNEYWKGEWPSDEPKKLAAKAENNERAAGLVDLMKKYQ